MIDEACHGVEEIRLTARQADCIALVAQGFSSKEIARELGISPSTVDNHIAIAMHQYGFPNRQAVARWYRTVTESAGGNPAKAVQSESPAASGQRGLIVPAVPFGGIRNSLSVKERIVSVAQVAILSTMATSAATTFVLGLIFLLNLRM